MEKLLRNRIYLRFKIEILILFFKIKSFALISENFSYLIFLLMLRNIFKILTCLKHKLKIRVLK
ncbi:MAG: hypothetical protein CBC01_01360 [Betaproteobacteria bacterium TMED41]|nr:MAG: hypothetical protein CBC01_01360 [Betaproteobacteria bacterium TMED41]